MGGGRRQRETRSGRGRLDSAAWGKVDERSYAQVGAWLSARVANKHDAQDLTQEAFVEFARANVGGDPKAYLWGIARNLLFQYRQKKTKERKLIARFRKEAARDSRAAHMRNLAEPPEEGAETQRDREVEGILDGLSAEQARLLRMKFWEELTVDQMARKLRCSEDAVYKRLERVLQQLREKYSDDAEATLG